MRIGNGHRKAQGGYLPYEHKVFSWKRLVSTVGPRRALGVLGGLYIVFGAGWLFSETGQGVPVVNTLLICLLIAGPGLVLVFGAYRLSRTDIAPEYYPGIVSWCLAGFSLMATLLVVYHLQPGESVSTQAPPILTGLASVAGFAVGVHDSRAKTRAHELQARNDVLRQTQIELEDTVDRLEQANYRLERYQKYTNDMLNGIDDLFYVLDVSGSLQRWNETLCEVSGYSDVEIASMSAQDFFDEPSQQTIANAVEEGFEMGNTQVEAQLCTKGGAHIPYEFAASTIENPDGETVLVGVGRDVTDRKKRESELSHRATQQQTVADLGQTALETDDLDDLMQEATCLVAEVLDAEYCKVLDLDSDDRELLLRQGVGWDDGIAGNATVGADEDDSQAGYTLRSEEPVVVSDLSTESRFSGPDLLTSHNVLSGVSTIIGPFGGPWGILGVHDTDRREFSDEDVSFVQSVANVLAEAIERHQYQRELEQLVADLEASNERLEQFAYAASHDLQEPLRMVSSYLRLLESRYEDDFDEEGQEFLDFAVDGADRMRTMIDGLLQYSRVETQGHQLEPIELNDVVEDVYNDLQVKIEDSDAQITTDSLPRVKGDPDQLRQVFQNLVDNAIEYSGDGRPLIHLTAQRRGTKWVISVRDDGIGIDAGDQDRIFEVFQRLHGTTERKGTGIGLALCERIVERHGGDIWVESEPGDGTEFSFTLPATDGSAD
ncbi:ATP-binding protein [Halobacteria archaeon AArc-dxtr1]|nr:ATP-binding protein [Halobacteria archaeon AArc-dxtr1]